MLENWKTYRLKEIADVQTGPFGSQLHKKDYVEVGTPIITVEHLGENRITYQNLPKVSETDKKRLSKYLIREGDIVFSRVGSVDRRALVTKKENNWLFSGRCLRVRADEKIANGAFLSYFFGKESFKEHIRSIAVGATMPSLNTSILNNVEVTLPSLEEQKYIASILSSLDDKIQLNLQMNKTLEEMALALFKHWFVDFEPFQNGEFIDVEFFGINRPLNIPEKFEVFKLKGIINRFKSKNKYSQKNVFPEGKVRVFDQSSSRILGFHDNEPDFQGTSNVPFLIFGDHTCRMELVSENFSVGPNLIPFKPKNPELTYVIYLGLVDKVKMNDYKRHWSELMLHQLVIPKDLNVVKKFNAHVRDYFNLIYQNEIQNQTLTQLRDTLLPKLISGEVRVRDEDKTLSEVL